LKIFLSYASEARDRAEGVNAALCASGHSVFFDRDDLPPGLDYDARIRAAIDDCDLFVFLISPAAVAAGHYTRTELKIARRRWDDPAGHVLPVMVEPTPFSELPAYLGSVTVLVPEGNLAAEVVLAVSDLAGSRAGGSEAPQPATASEPGARYTSLTLSFEPGDAGRYTLSLQGARATCVLDAPAIERALWQDASASTDTLRRATPGFTGLPGARQAREVGRQLHEALFGADLRAPLLAHLRTMDAQSGNGLRFVIDTTHTPELARLPWEFLYSPDKDDFLFSDRMKPVVRWLDTGEPVPTLHIDGPLKVLIAFAAPGRLAHLRIGEEISRLDEALGELAARGQVQVTRLAHATLESLDDALLRQGAHVLHFIGHGDFDGDEGVLLLEGEDGAPDPLTGRRLGVLLRNHLGSLRLVFLNSCMGATVSPADPFGGIAQTLIRRGVPAVIAMQFAVPDKAAIALARHFYRYLAAGQPVDAALTSARAFLYARGFEVEWGAPALHMRAPDGRLFDIAAAPEQAPARMPTPAAEIDSRVSADDAASPAPAIPSAPATASSGRRRVGAFAIGAVLLLAATAALVAFLGGGGRGDAGETASGVGDGTSGPAAGAPLPRPSSRTPIDRALAQLAAADDAAAAATLENLLRADPQALDARRLGELAPKLDELLWRAATRTAAQQRPELAARLQRIGALIHHNDSAAIEPAPVVVAPDAPARVDLRFSEFAVDVNAALERGDDEGAAALIEQAVARGFVPPHTAAAGDLALKLSAGLNLAAQRSPRFAPLFDTLRRALIDAETAGEAAAAASGQEPLYVVRRGDTLSGIAARLLGDTQRWPELVAAQRTRIGLSGARLRAITDPDRLYAGERLAVPPAIDELGRATWHYHVQRGDTLWSIAARMYGDGRLWRRIADGNEGSVTNADRIRPGQVLVVPPRAPR
jgi:nucleoid-associated protein YgaU